MKEYIDRNALLKDICGNDPSHMEDYYFNAIANAPTADVVEVRHGEWKPIDPESDVRFFCSKCETEISTSWDYDEETMWRYCPCCGAKMDGERKEQT